MWTPPVCCQYQCTRRHMGSYDREPQSKRLVLVRADAQAARSRQWLQEPQKPGCDQRLRSPFRSATIRLRYQPRSLNRPRQFERARTPRSRPECSGASPGTYCPSASGRNPIREPLKSLKCLVERFAYELLGSTSHLPATELPSRLARNTDESNGQRKTFPCEQH